MPRSSRGPTPDAATAGRRSTRIGIRPCRPRRSLCDKAATPLAICVIAAFLGGLVPTAAGAHANAQEAGNRHGSRDARRIAHGLLDLLKANEDSVQTYAVRMIGRAWYAWEPIDIDAWPSRDRAAFVETVTYLRKGTTFRYSRLARNTGKGDQVYRKVASALVPTRRVIRNRDGEIIMMIAPPEQKGLRKNWLSEHREDWLADARAGSIYFGKFLRPSPTRHHGPPARYFADLLDAQRTFAPGHRLSTPPVALSPFGGPRGAIVELQRALQRGDDVHLAMGIEYRDHRCALLSWRSEESGVITDLFWPDPDASKAYRTLEQWRCYVDLCCPGMLRGIEHTSEYYTGPHLSVRTIFRHRRKVVYECSKKEGIWIAWDVREVSQERRLTDSGQELEWCVARQIVAESVSLDPPPDEAMALELPEYTLVKSRDPLRPGPGRILLSDRLTLTPANFVQWFRNTWDRLAVPPTGPPALDHAASPRTFQPGVRIVAGTALLTLAVFVWFFAAMRRARRKGEGGHET